MHKNMNISTSITKNATHSERWLLGAVAAPSSVTQVTTHIQHVAVAMHRGSSNKGNMGLHMAQGLRL
jgi:hypothetical protein